jgi:hypothetical protein
MTHAIAKVLHRRPMLIGLLLLTLLSVGYTVGHHALSKKENTWHQPIDDLLEYLDVKEKIKTLDRMVRKVVPEVQEHVPKRMPKI